MSTPHSLYVGTKMPGTVLNFIAIWHVRTRGWNLTNFYVLVLFSDEEFFAQTNCMCFERECYSATIAMNKNIFSIPYLWIYHTVTFYNFQYSAAKFAKIHTIEFLAICIGQIFG